MFTKKKQRTADPAARKAALKGRPHQLPPVREEEKDGKLYVTVRFSRPGWQRLLGAPNTCERTFGLDPSRTIVLRPHVILPWLGRTIP